MHRYDTVTMMTRTLETGAGGCEMVWGLLGV